MSEREYKRMGREKQRAIMKEKEDEEVEKLFCISFFPLTMLEMLLAEEWGISQAPINHRERGNRARCQDITLQDYSQNSCH